MSKTLYEIVQFSWKGFGPNTVIEPGIYHDDGKWVEGVCQEPETEDGCKACQDEMEEVENEIVRQYKAKGRELIYSMLINDPPIDGYWEYALDTRPLRYTSDIL